MAVEELVLPTGARSALQRMRVATHLHDRATKYTGNTATISATGLCRWFKAAFVDRGLAEAIAPSPYTDPSVWVQHQPGDPAMTTLLNHARSLKDRAAELGFPVIPSVEAQMVPVKPGVLHSMRYVLDIPVEVAAQHVVIASVHAQPRDTEKRLSHVQASRYAALNHPHVHWLSHLDRYVNELPFPDLQFFREAARARKAIGVNENYLATKARVLSPGRALRRSWGSLLDGEILLTKAQFECLDGVGPDEYPDYRWSHILALIERAGCQIVVEYDWHLPASPEGVDLVSGDLGRVAIARLERLGNWLDLRGVPDELVLTRSLEAFTGYFGLEL